MAVGDIYKIFVSYNGGGKELFAVEIGRVDLMMVLMDSITSKYDEKSDHIKKKYYPIKNYLEAGLKKPSFVDIKSTKKYKALEVLKEGEYIGKLTMEDLEALALFIKSYKKRVQK